MMKAAKVTIDRIEPTNWYVGLKNPQVQLMVYGKDISSVKTVTTDYQGVTIDSIVRLDSPNYLLLYLNVSNAQPGTMTLKFDKRKTEYQLKGREMDGTQRRGFDISDVLYLLMPDRFASGRSDNDQIAGLNNYVNDRSKPSLRHGGDMEGIQHCGSHPYWRTTRPTPTTDTPHTMAMLPPIIIRWTPASAPTTSTGAWSTRHTARD